MKVLYKNKVGSLIPLKGCNCQNCIFHPKYSFISCCKKIGLMQLCVGLSNYYVFILSSSDVLTYEN